MKPARIDLNLAQLQAFVHIVAAGSFRGAALQMGVSQPALSRAIRQAEEVIGSRLFDRDTRNLQITAVGQELLPIAQRVLREFDASFGELGQFLQGRTGKVAIATLPSTGASLLATAVASFRALHPQVEFTLVEAAADSLLNAVDEGRADFGLSVKPAPDRRLRYHHLLDDPFMLLCRRDDPLAARLSVPWSIFAARAFIAAQPRSSIRQLTDAVFLQRRMNVRASLECPSVSACSALVMANVGIAAVPRLALSLVDMQGLCAVPLVRPQMLRSIGIITRIGRSLSPASMAFMAHLTAQIETGP
ncbi:LysR family transcriptional regulator [Ottowia sp. GY511]|uniref:LysR family transcriptional regulator n=1 Tax=Ottowia flava TaxID=2675430 RepID=A0ABW4KTL7_9BURK|nr:LysR family transcriptional regulator [Ottowia sp. GY511]TXK33685.1 LysR family transcriptional regulator [Ottowia sp. GY511]